MVSFSATDAEARIIEKVVNRASNAGLIDDALSFEMDLFATNANGTPLDFEKLLAFDDFSFSHDVVGIQEHISRNTGKLTRHFLPRCAKSTAKEAE